MGVARLSRQEFLADYWDYQPGEHVSIIEPTQGGKTHLMYQMLDTAMQRNPGLRTVSCMPKPRDPATWGWADRLGLKVIEKWPPPPAWLGDKPRGYVLWPKHLNGTSREVNRIHLAGQFRPALTAQYEKGNSITMADDVYLMAVMLGLNMDLEEFWTSGSAGNAGLWSTNQKPSGTVGGGSVSSFSYNSPTHLLLGHDPDQRNRRRFAEIGGVDPELVARIVFSLRKHRIGNKNISDKLYIHKGGPYMAIVGP